MTGKQADQILADTASGEDVRSGTDGGASTKIQQNAARALNAMCKFKANFIQKPNRERARDKILLKCPMRENSLAGADYL